jgi:hypothetical protein
MIATAVGSAQRYCGTNAAQPVGFALLRKRRNSAEMLTATQLQLKYMLYMLFMLRRHSPASQECGRAPLT